MPELAEIYDIEPSMDLRKEYLKYPKNPIHLGNLGTRYNSNINNDKF